MSRDNNWNYGVHHHRDAAVVPWISLRHKDDDDDTSSSFSGFFAHDSTSASSSRDDDDEDDDDGSRHHRRPTTAAGSRNNARGPSSSYSSSPSSSSYYSSSSRNNNRILSLLGARERVGSREGQRGGGGGVASGTAGGVGLVVTNEGLSRAGAWNPRRLQNMTLAVGPGTPASCVVLAEPSSSSSSDEIGDEDDDDDEEMFREEEGSEDADVGRNRGEGLRDDDELEDDDDDDDDDDDKEEETMEVLPADAEEGQEYHFDESGRLVRDDVEEDTTTDVIARRQQPHARITQSPGDTNEGENDDDDDAGDDDDDHRPRRGWTGRSRWEKRQQSVLDALNGAGNNREEEEDDVGGDDSSAAVADDDDDSGDSHHTNVQNSDDQSNGAGGGGNVNDESSSRGGDEDMSADGSGLTARDVHNIRQVEQYIDHIELLHRRREERREEEEEEDRRRQSGGVLPSLSSASARVHERETSRSMKHSGCINTASWLDCGWRISTVSHEDAVPYYLRDLQRYGGDGDDDDGFVSSSSSFSSNNYPPRGASPGIGRGRTCRGRGDGPVAPLAPTECPTQLLTSGDDHLVKFWDVASAMGSTSPLPGGSATIAPFSSPGMPMRACSELVDRWKNHHTGGYASSFVGSSAHRHHGRHLPGVVHPLATLSTGHRGNVFHATPVPNSPGKVATCAADGYLRLLDVEVHSRATSPGGGGAARNRSDSAGGDSSTIVISPEYQSENNGEGGGSAFRFRHSLMCFSHHFLSANVGLACSERGLLHFDLRLPARSQRRGSIVAELGSTCKACFPWRLGSASEGADGGGELESAYVFAGGAGVDVGLYDLRMPSSSSSSSGEDGGDGQVVQKYRPRALRRSSSSVAVSGIDLSRDKRELLVSYESDHVYTFPIFPDAASAAGPTLSDIDNANAAGGNRGTDGHPVPELAAYGGHLNRLTFLKMAKYAGPKDEYICTGSDSGHAWIYERQTGTVASFVKADNSTCNGIQPHPTLPYFITYGIDSTAKLWRATGPVDGDVDDSDMGRFNYSRGVKYEKSIVADQWKKARRGKEIDLEDDELGFFPDETSKDDNDDPDHFLGVFIRSRFSEEEPFIGNDMANLTTILARNYYTTARSIGTGEEEPVKSGIGAMKRRVNLIKMRHQADRLGLVFDSRMPWILRPKEHLLRNFLNKEGGIGGKGDMVSYGSLADLVPDNPSDWIPFEKLLAKPPHPGGMQFNDRYERYCLESSSDRSVAPIARACPVKLDVEDVNGKAENATSIVDELDRTVSKQPHSIQSNTELAKSAENDESSSAQAWDVLFQTVCLLKEAGNEALKNSLPFLAARRYDKAINYGSTAYLEFPVGNANFLAEHQYVVSKNSGYECRWNELLKTLLMVRLNLAVCFLKEEINDTKGAVTQANLALKELKPFVSEKGVVLTGKKLSKQRTDEPLDTYTQAKALQAKAYFRMGSAQLAMHNYDDAVKTFELCVESTREADIKIDAGTMRKINEAKRCRRKKKENQRKKFKFMFSSEDGEEPQT